MTTKKTAPGKPVDTALAWVDNIRQSEMGHSENERKLITLADEVKRLRRDLRTAQMSTRRGALQAVPTPADADDMAEAAMELIDTMGAPPLPRRAWVGLLNEVISQCRTRIAAAQDDDRNGR